MYAIFLCLRRHCRLYTGANHLAVLANSIFLPSQHEPALAPLLMDLFSLDQVYCILSHTGLNRLN